MILLLDTSTYTCYVTLVEDDVWSNYEWQADRTLARDLLSYLRDKLAEHDKTFGDLRGLGVHKGPGSFTGLRIGITVMNTLAESLEIPIVGASGDGWRGDALSRLAVNMNDKLVLPEYGAEANITKPRK